MGLDHSIDSEKEGRLSAQIPENPPPIAKNDAAIFEGSLKLIFQRSAAIAKTGAVKRMIIMPTRLDALRELAPGKILLMIGQALME